MKLAPWTFVLLLLAAGLPVVNAQGGTSSPWWDPPEVKSPTDFANGWNFRVPLRVTNTLPYPITPTDPISVHLHMNQLAAEAGWLQSTIGGLPVSRGFTFDLPSVRLVEYGTNWQTILGEVPIDVSPVWFEPDQTARFGRLQGQPYSDRQNPVVTITWVPPADLAPGATRYYFAYFEAKENSAKSPAEMDPAARERLDAVHWIGRGTEIWGWAQGSQTPSVGVTATQPNTNVEVLEYKVGFPRPTRRILTGTPNPFTVANVGDERLFLLSPGDLAFKVVADKPVIVRQFRMTGPGTMVHNNFFPSIDGNLLGTRFFFDGTNLPAVYASWKPDPAHTTNTVTIMGGGLVPMNGQVTMNAPDGFAQFTGFQNGVRYEINSEHPIVLQPRPGSGGAFAIPSAETGAAQGRWFHAALSFQGGARVTFRGLDDASHPTVYPLPFTDAPVYPTAGNPLMPLFPGIANQQALALANAVGFPPPPSSPSYTLPHQLWSSDAENLPAEQKGRFTAFSGPNTPITTPWGGGGARHFNVTGPNVLFALYGSTDVEIRRLTNPASVTRVSIERDGITSIGTAPADATANFEIISNKPVVVVPVLRSGSYERFFGGRIPSVPVIVGEPEFRGFLIELESQDGGNPIFATGRPGQTINVGVNVRNLGRWIGGIALEDTVTVRAIPAPGWTGTLAWTNSGVTQTQVQLVGTGDVETLQLEATIPNGVPAGTTFSILIEAVSGGNNRIRDTLQLLLFVEQEFGVRMWWDVGGATNVKDIVRDLQPGDPPRTYRVFLENSGTGVDTYDLHWTEPALGWDIVVIDPADPSREVTSITIPAGERRVLNVIVHPPATLDQETSTVFVLEALSRSSVSAAELVQAQFRLNIPADIRLTSITPRLTVEPGASTEFVLRLANEGTSGTTITVRVPTVPPAGWTATVVDVATINGEHRISLGAGHTFDFRVNVTAPTDAIYGKFVPLLVEAVVSDQSSSTRQATGLVAQVGLVANFTADAPSTIDAAPGSTISLRIHLNHTGNAPATFRVLPSRLPSGWRVLTVPQLVLPVATPPSHGSQGNINLNITIPAGTEAGTYDAELIVMNQAGGNITLPLQVTVARLDRGALSLEPTQIMLGPNSRESAVARIHNDGNAPLTVAISAQMPSGWGVSIEPATLTVPAQRNASQLLRFTAPASATPGTFKVPIVARDETTGNESQAELTIHYRLPDVEVTTVRIVTPPAQLDGDPVILAATVTNKGGAAASSINISLAVDNVFVDGVELDRLEPNATAIVTLQMIWRASTGTIQVVADPKQGVVESSTENNMKDVALEDVSADPVGGQAPSVALPLAVFALLTALVVRRRRTE